MLKGTTAGVLLLASFNMAVAGSGIKTLVPSDVLKASANTQRTATGFPEYVIKQIQVAYGGKVRVSFEMAAGPGTTEEEPAQCSIGNNSYKTTSTTFQTFTDDVPVAARGSITMFCNAGLDQNFDDTAVIVRNFRLFYDIKMVSDDPRVLNN
jgi:hypothetical protein